jgi:hypothetical protein
LTVVEYAAGAPLHGADATPAYEPWSSPGSKTNLMFANERYDPFDIGASAYEIVRATDRRLSTSGPVCVLAYHLTLQEGPAPSFPSELPQTTDRAVAKATVSIVHSRGVDIHSVDVVRRGDGNVDLRANKTASDLPTAATCQDIRSSAESTLNVTEGLTFVNGFPISKGRVLGFSHVGSTSLRGHPGRDTWAFSFVPAHIENESRSKLYQPYELAFAPDDSLQLTRAFIGRTDRWW